MFKMRKGTRIIITGTRALITEKYKKLTRQEGKFIGYKEQTAFLMFSKEGTPLRYSSFMPPNCLLWSPFHDKELPNKTNFAIACLVPIFELDDGTKTNGDQVYWQPKNPKIKARFDKARDLLLEKIERSKRTILNSYDCDDELYGYPD